MCASPPAHAGSQRAQKGDLTAVPGAITPTPGPLEAVERRPELPGHSDSEQGVACVGGGQEKDTPCRQQFVEMF